MRRIGFNLGCSGYVYGLALAKALLEVLPTAFCFSQAKRIQIHASKIKATEHCWNAGSATLISSDGFAKSELQFGHRW